MIPAAVARSLRVLRMRPIGRAGSSFSVATHERHHRDARLEAGQPEREPRKNEQRHRDHQHRVAVLRKECLPPITEHDGMADDLRETDRDDDGVEREIDRDEHDCDPNRLAESFEEDRTEKRDEEEGDRDPLPTQEAGGERIFGDVCRRVRRGERDRDNEVCRGKAKQDEDEEFPLPPREELRQHRDRAFAVRARHRDTTIDRQRTEQRHENEHDRRDRREYARRERRDSWLITERGEVIHTRETHHTPPRLRRVRRALVRPLHRRLM